jgi:hypothetical protein
MTDTTTEAYPTLRRQISRVGTEMRSSWVVYYTNAQGASRSKLFRIKQEAVEFHAAQLQPGRFRVRLDA